MYKIINNKNQTKKIIIMVLIVLLFNFVIPTYSQAGILLNFFSNILVFFPDKIIEGLQEILIGDGNITNNGKYSIKVSPGIIFAGKIPLLDINFINSKEDSSTNEIILGDIIETNSKTEKKEDVSIDYNEYILNNKKENLFDGYIRENFTYYFTENQEAELINYSFTDNRNDYSE